jgi:hypothetical protein
MEFEFPEERGVLRIELLAKRKRYYVLCTRIPLVCFPPALLHDELSEKAVALSRDGITESPRLIYARAFSSKEIRSS